MNTQSYYNQNTAQSNRLETSINLHNPVINHGDIDAMRKNPDYQVELKRCRDIAAYNNSYPRGGPIPKIVDTKLVEFYGNDNGDGDKYGKWLSNCTASWFNVGGKSYPSSETYYQYCKFAEIGDDNVSIMMWCARQNKDFEETLANLKNHRSKIWNATPGGAARLGQTREVPMRADWDNVKVDIMWTALVAKFSANLDFANALRDTGSRILIERTPSDGYWGVNNQGVGENMLGLLLMILRGEMFGL